MTIKNYLMVQENIVNNIVLWDGNPETWTPPSDVIMLEQDTTMCMVWELNIESKNYVLTEQLGVGAIGFTWDGTILTTNEPKPELPQPALDQPTTTGTVTI